MISGWGNSKPQGVFIIDSPTKDDMREGKACTKYTSKLIGDYLREHSLNPSNFYYTSLYKEPLELPQNKKEIDNFFDKTLAQDNHNFSRILSQEIKELQPNLLIPMGELSFRWATNLKGIRKFRGSILKSHSVNLGLGGDRFKVLPILGPNPFLNQEYSLRFVTRLDFGKIHKYLNDGPIPDAGTKLWIASNPEQVSHFFNRSYNGAEFVVFDIETFMGIPTCISFCFDGVESCCIPILDWNIDFGTRALMLNSVAKLLASPIPKVNQNIKYDWKILERFGFKVNNVVGDTMLASNCIYPEFPKNLGFLTSIYTDLPYFKDEGKEYDPKQHKREQFYLYNAKDSLATHQIYVKQQADLREQGSFDVYQNLIRCQPIYRRMEDTGILINEERRLELQGKYESKYRIETLKLKMMAERDINPQSPLQVRSLIYDKLQFKAGRNNTGTSEEELENLYEFGESKVSPIYGKDILKSIINCRKLHKVIEILELPPYPDGRFRAEWNLAGTQNARTTTGKCTDDIIVFAESGRVKQDGNRVLEKVQLGYAIQNIGKHGFSIDAETYGQDIRSMYIADDGYSFVEMDLSGAEARVDRVLSGNFDMSVFDSPGIHKLTASWIYDCEPSEIKKHVLVDGVDRYHMGKTVRHAGERNMTAPRLVLMLQRPLHECKIALDKFHKFQPEIRQVFHADIRAAVNNGRRLVAPNGRCRDFFDRVDEHTYNEAISTLPQMIVADQMKFSFPEIFGEKEGFAYKWAHLVFEAHDGAMALIPKGRETEYIERSKVIMERPIDFRTCTLAREFELIIPVEAAVGVVWDKLEEIKL